MYSSHLRGVVIWCAFTPDASHRGGRSTVRWPIVRLGVNDGIAIITRQLYNENRGYTPFFPSFLARSVPAYSLSRHIIAFITPTPRNCGAPVVLNPLVIRLAKKYENFLRIHDRTTDPIVIPSNPLNKRKKHLLDSFLI